MPATFTPSLTSTSRHPNAWRLSRNRLSLPSHGCVASVAIAQDAARLHVTIANHVTAGSIVFVWVNLFRLSTLNRQAASLREIELWSKTARAQPDTPRRGAMLVWRKNAKERFSQTFTALLSSEGSLMVSKTDHSVVVTSAGLKALNAKPMSKTEHSALWELPASLPPSGDVVSQSDIASRIFASAGHVNKAIKTLCRHGFRLRGQKEGVSYHYRPNPAYLRRLPGQ
jgi:biotin operon repressor